MLRQQPDELLVSTPATGYRSIMLPASNQSRRADAHVLIDHLFDYFDAAEGIDDEPPADEAAFRIWCYIAEILSPEICDFLRRDALDAVGGKLPPPIDRTTIGREPTPPEHKKFAGQVIGRILYDLTDAIGNTFPGGPSTVGKIIADLVEPQSQSRILPDRQRGDQSHGFRMEKGSAAALVFEIIIYEQARRGLRLQTEAADEIFGHGTIQDGLLQTFRRQFRKRTDPRYRDKNLIRQQAREPDAPPHPALYLWGNKLSALLELARKR
jgi:hypothetical protein